MAVTAPQTHQNSTAGIAFLLVGLFCISINDMLIKKLSGDYPLHQMVFVRTTVGLAFTFGMMRIEGGWSVLKTGRVGLHFIRSLLIVTANLSFFAALAVLPLADATALFFVAPLFITLLSVFFLGETVGVRRIAAVIVGFVGVIIMFRPGAGAPASLAVMALPVVAALAYAAFQIMTRKLGASSKASALTFYPQVTFIAVSIGFFLVAGDGRFAEGQDSEVLIFLLRAWVWPSQADWPFFGLLGVLSALVGYTMAQAYRLGEAATIAPFEYTELPMAIFWGWMVFGTWPDIPVWIGLVLIIGSGLYVFVRERQKGRPVSAGRRMRRW